MKQTLNLRDNPFDPDLDGTGRRGGDPLGAEPVSDAPDLLCMNIAGMEPAEARLRFALFLDNAAEDAAVRRNVILLIVGARGSGKTTLANLIRRRFPIKGSGAWMPFDLLFDPYVPPPDLLGTFVTFRNSIAEKFGDGSGRALIVIDNLPKDAFNYVMSMFNAFPRVTRVFIVTTTDFALLNDEGIYESGIHIEPVELKKLTAEEVRTFIRDRVPKFHAAKLVPLEAEADLSLFPFDLDAPQSAAGKPLQGVRNWAYRRIDDKHLELLNRSPLVDAALADAAELRTRLIQS